MMLSLLHWIAHERAGGRRQQRLRHRREVDIGAEVHDQDVIVVAVAVVAQDEGVRSEHGAVDAAMRGGSDHRVVAPDSQQIGMHRHVASCASHSSQSSFESSKARGSSGTGSFSRILGSRALGNCSRNCRRPSRIASRSPSP